MEARTAKIYHILRLDDEGFWTDLPGGDTFRDIEQAKTAARHFRAASGKRTRVEDSDRHCWLDTKFDPIEEIARMEAMGS